MLAIFSGYLGKYQYTSGDRELGMRTLQEMTAQCKELNDRYFTSMFLMFQAEFLVQENAFQQAKECLLEAQKSSVEQSRSAIQLELASILAQEGDIETALSYVHNLDKMIALYPVFYCRSLCQQVQVYVHAKDFERAKEVFQAAEQQYNQYNLSQVYALKPFFAHVKMMVGRL